MDFIDSFTLKEARLSHDIIVGFLKTVYALFDPYVCSTSRLFFSRVVSCYTEKNSSGVGVKKEN